MSSRRLRTFFVVVAGLTCILTPPLWSQPVSGSANLDVRVVHGNERPTETRLRVELLTASTLVITSAFTDSNGMAFFGGLRGGSYRLRVTGPEIAEIVTGIFFIDPRERSHTEVVTVHPPTPTPSAASKQTSIAVVDLNVPRRAQKEFEKGTEAFNRAELDRAREQFAKAIAAYPSYASAYNYLGMTLMRMGEIQPAQQAFEKAIELNDRFALAYTNLAKLHFAQRNLERSESLLRKSVAAEPRSSEAWAILSQVQLMSGKYEDAIVNARRVHDLPHQEYAIAHFVAARALRARNLREDAMAEYKLFLQEAPNSTSSPQARQELSQLESQRP